jgi:hypothetical protein
VERAAVKQGGVVAVDDPDPPGFGSLQDSRGFYHHFAFALPFGLASTHAGVWQCRPAVASSGRLTSSARSRASAVPSFSRPLHQPGAGIPAGTDEMLMSVISFRMAPRGAASSSWVSRIFAGRAGRDGFSSSGSPTRNDYEPSCTPCGANWRGVVIGPFLSRAAGLPVSCAGTPTTTGCLAITERCMPSVPKSCGSGDRRFGVAASAHD